MSAVLIADSAAAAAFNDVVKYTQHHRPSTYIVASTNDASIRLVLASLFA